MLLNGVLGKCRILEARQHQLRSLDKNTLGTAGLLSFHTAEEEKSISSNNRNVAIVMS